MGAPADAVDAGVEQIYGALLHGPRKLPPMQDMGLPVKSPEGTQALSDAIHALLEGRVQYIHQGNHLLLPVSCLLQRISIWPHPYGQY
jgi:hypothetical protein